MVNDNSEKIKKRIIQILREHPEGLTIQDLSNTMKMHRQTVTKYVLWLVGEGVVHRRRIGAITLHYLKEKFVQKISEKEILKKLRKRI